MATKKKATSKADMQKNKARAGKQSGGQTKKAIAKASASPSTTRAEKQSGGQTPLNSASASPRSGVTSSFLKEKTFKSLKTSSLAATEIPLEVNDTFCKIETVFLPFDTTAIDDEFLKFIKNKSSGLAKLVRKFRTLLEDDVHWKEFLADGNLCLYLPSRKIALPHPARWREFHSNKKRFSDTITGDLLPEDFFKDFSQCPQDKSNPWTIFSCLVKSQESSPKKQLEPVVRQGIKNVAVTFFPQLPQIGKKIDSIMDMLGDRKFHFIVRRGRSGIKSARWPFHPSSYAGYSCSDINGKFVLPCYCHSENTLYSFLKAHFVPNLAEYQELLEYYIQHPGWFCNDDTLNIKSILADFRAGKTIWGWDRNELVKMGREGNIPFHGKESAIFEEKLLNCDQVRFDGDVYKKNILTDYHQGHWDLWPGENVQEKPETANGVPIALERPFYGRNPLVDVRADGIVAIDFGTKSTSVAFLDGGREICPFPIGCPKYQTNSPINEYENPTVLNFIDYNTFLQAYKHRLGRPFTQWSTLTVSHTANNAFEEGTDADSLASVISELKQWTASGKKLYLTDHVSRKKGKLLVFNPFLEIEDDDVDPVEIYAYYIGCSLNNMYNKIFLNYLLSFSITYDERTKARIRRSFEKGLRKSLPNTILNDQKAMEKFTVTYGCSEPEAYAVCALEQLGLLPDERNPKTFYGVFDFGGGTTDFDFGCCSIPDEDDGFDYDLEHFDANGYGDRYLGGENILRSLAYMVFKENRSSLFSQNISFASPYENAAVLANEGKFVSDSLEAEMNIRLLMTKLRPLWEAPDSKEAMAFDSGEIRLTLFNDSGEQCSGIKLRLDREDLLRWIHDRVSRGIANFFAALKSSYLNNPQWESTQKIHILLAGNSCKAAIVKEIFDEHCAAFGKANRRMKAFFEIHLPLGENPDEKKLVSTREFYRPNGKTGVVWGLLLGRDGGAFHQKKRGGKTARHVDDTKFNFFVGRSVRGNFDAKLSPLSGGNWVLFRKANTRTIEFYYTTDPGASTGMVKADRFVRGVIETIDEESWIVIRPKTVASFEYAVAKSLADAEKQKFQIQPEELFLK